MRNRAFTDSEDWQNVVQGKRDHRFLAGQKPVDDRGGPVLEFATPPTDEQLDQLKRLYDIAQRIEDEARLFNEKVQSDRNPQ